MTRGLMAIMVVCLGFIPFSGLSAQSKEASVTLSKDGNYVVTSGAVSMTVDPRVGGTIDSLSFNGSEFLTGKEVHSFFYGSTFWPSPQSDWNWPPPPVLNVEPYAAKVEDDTLVLVSGEDPKTGFQFTKEIFPGRKATINLRYGITNISDSVRKVAPWEITRVRKGGLLFFPIGTNQLGKKSFGPVPVRISRGIAWYSDSTARPTDNLLSTADGTEGWAAYAIDGKLFVKKFPNIEPAERAPGEGEIAIYVSAVADYVEFEVQGKYDTLGPGRSSTWQVTWIVADLPSDAAAREGNLALVDFARKLAK